MKESEIIAEAERLLTSSNTTDEGYVTVDDMRRAGYTDYAAQKALQTLFLADRLETKRVKRTTRAGYMQSFPGYKVKPEPA